MCKNQYGFCLDNARVKVAESKFTKAEHRNPGYRCHLNYRRIWELLCESRTLTDIAILAGVERTWMGVLYFNYFMEFFGNERPIERYRRLQFDEVQRRRKAVQLPDLPSFELLKEIGEKRKLLIEPDFTNDGRLKLTSVRVFGTACTIHPVTSCMRRDDRSPRFTLRFMRKMLGPNDFHLVPLFIPEVKGHVLVLPTEEIEQRLFTESDDGDRRASISVRLSSLRRSSGRERLPVSEFVDNWGLLKAAA